MKAILERIEFNHKRSVLAFNYAKKDFDAPMHFHPQYELTYIVESTGTRFVGDHISTYEAGELVLLKSNLPHCWKNEPREAGQARSVVIQWNPGVFPSIPELEGVQKMLKEASYGLWFSAATCQDVLPLLRQLPDLKGHSLYLQLLSVLAQLSTYNYERLSSMEFSKKHLQEYTGRMDKVNNFVRTYYHRKIYLKEVSDEVGMSEQAFSRFFSKMMGRPFFAFLNEYRVDMACRFLADTDMPVAQVGYSCGYDSLPFFYKQFKKYKNTSPSAYRRSFL